jgi:hypothetical protein
MGGPVERPVKIHTSALVLDFSLTHTPFDVSLQDEMAIILKRSQDQTFWIEEAMVEFAVDTTLELRINTRLDDEVSLVATRVEVQAD